MQSVETSYPCLRLWLSFYFKERRRIKYSKIRFTLFKAIHSLSNAWRWSWKVLFPWKSAKSTLFVRQKRIGICQSKIWYCWLFTSKGKLCTAWESSSRLENIWWSSFSKHVISREQLQIIHTVCQKSLCPLSKISHQISATSRLGVWSLFWGWFESWDLIKLWDRVASRSDRELNVTK